MHVRDKACDRLGVVPVVVTACGVVCVALCKGPPYLCCALHACPGRWYVVLHARLWVGWQVQVVPAAEQGSQPGSTHTASALSFPCLSCYVPARMHSACMWDQVGKASQMLSVSCHTCTPPERWGTAKAAQRGVYLGGANPARASCSLTLRSSLLNL